MMQETKRYFCHWMGALFVLAFSSACGIDQGDQRVVPPDQSLPVAQTTYGPITGFGSILLNGVTVDVSNAAILANGLPVTEGDLNVGQIVRVQSLVDNNQLSAFLVEYRDNAVGPIANLDAVAGTFTVLDQQVQADADTIINVAGAASLGDLVDNDLVEISAFRDQAGILRARYIGEAALNAPLDISTSITAVDLAAQTFSLGGLTVDYSQVQVIELPNGEPTPGLVVEVDGVSVNANGQLVASTVTVLPADPGIFSATDTSSENDALAMAATGGFDGFDVDFLGFINVTDLPASVSIGDVVIEIDGSTVIDGGGVNDLVEGLFIQVNGEVTALGNVRATRITIL